MGLRLGADGTESPSLLPKYPKISRSKKPKHLHSAKPGTQAPKEANQHKTNPKATILNLKSSNLKPDLRQRPVDGGLHRGLQRRVAHQGSQELVLLSKGLQGFGFRVGV